ncbi:replicative DNA helicase, partial [Corallococcus coralloides]|nr:replicative DNA helicase [Corallococcus coralloides]
MSSDFPPILESDFAPAPASPVDQEVARLRVPPHSLEAESSVLGGLLLDNMAWDRVGDLLVDG